MARNLGGRPRYGISLFESMKLDERTGCWNWTGPKRRKGYGAITFGGKVHSVHRVAAWVWKGFDLKSKLFVCHSCDNPSCYNPKHLFVGTARENNLDCIQKGRNPYVFASKRVPHLVE